MKTKTTIIYSEILLTGMLIMLGLNYFKPIDIPTNIPFTVIPIFGTVLVTLYLIVLISAEKRILKLKPQTTLFTLTLTGAVIITSCEFIYQLVRLFTFDFESFSEYFYLFISGFLGSSLFGSVLAFLTAFQLKTKKTGMLVLFIIGFLIILNVILLF